MTDPPEGKTVCPGDFTNPLPYEVIATDVCGNDLGDSIKATQTLDFPDNNTCAGTVTNTWSVQPPGCNASEPVTGTQTITVEDSEKPIFVDPVLADVVFTCPADFNVSSLIKPFATDNCDKDVEVYTEDANLTGCEDLDITWTALDKCGNEETITQTIRLDDHSPPLLKSVPPSDVILKCSDPLPLASELVFGDNCEGDISVNSSDANDGESYCIGNTTTRTWAGPSDTCGNTATDVVQQITVMDQSPPVMPVQFPLLNLTCPNKFDVTTLVPPNATDDCTPSNDIIVVGISTPIFACNPVMVTWTATDACGHSFNSYQQVCP
jgi:large repetitive protein